MNIKAGRDSNELGLPVDVEVNALVVAEDHEFKKPHSVSHVIGSKKGPDYRERALKLCIDARVAFRSTPNNFWDMSRRFISVHCPYCNDGTNMKFSNSQSQTSDMGCSRYECVVCKCAVTLTMQHNGISIYPAKSTK